MLQPIGPFILIKPDKLKQQVGSIFLPEDRQESQTEGTVIKLGNRNRTVKGAEIPFSVKEGDRVLFERMEAYDPGRVTIDGEYYFLMPESKVLAAVE